MSTRIMTQRKMTVTVCTASRIPMTAPRAVAVDESLTSLANIVSLQLTIGQV